jgi:drug/metabolite transporter (DMT)-like permease
VPIALASAALFGASTPFVKLLLGGGLDPWLLAGLLYLGAGLGLGLMALARGGGIEAPLRRRDLPRLALITTIGGILGPVLLMFGLAQTSASTASLLLNLEGLATMGIAWLLFREPVDGRLLLGAAAILAGAVMLSWQGGPAAFGWGAAAVVSACLAWGLDNNLTRTLSSTDPVQIAAAKSLVAGVANTSLALLGGVLLPLPASVAGAMAIGLLGYGASLVLFVLALRHLGTARTAAYFSSAPFLGAALAVFMLGEPISAQLLVAGALMALGVYLHVSERHDHEHAHEAMEHEHRHEHDEHHRHRHEAATQPHSHRHRHAPLIHAHPHYPDPHHRHGHRGEQDGCPPWGLRQCSNGDGYVGGRRFQAGP